MLLFSSYKKSMENIYQALEKIVYDIVIKNRQNLTPLTLAAYLARKKVIL